MENVDHERLAEKDGKDGRPTFVAVDGEVYDLSGSGMWTNGSHMGRHDAGRDLTEALADAPHGKEVLDRFEKVGPLAGAREEAAPSQRTAAPQRPGWITRLLGLHPHPISVHFPQALLTLAPVFLVLFYVTGNEHLERSCYYLAVAGWISSIPTFATGILHWVYKYGRSTKRLYTFKLGVSIVLVVYAAVVILVHTSRGVLAPDPVDGLMIVLYLLLLPLTTATGHAGGKIVFG